MELSFKSANIDITVRRPEKELDEFDMYDTARFFAELIQRMDISRPSELLACMVLDFNNDDEFIDETSVDVNACHDLVTAAKAIVAVWETFDADFIRRIRERD